MVHIPGGRGELHIVGYTGRPERVGQYIKG